MLPNPKRTIDQELSFFDNDPETRLTESTLAKLINALPKNQKTEHVLLKVISISTLYRARVLNKDYQCVAEHIASLRIDDKLRNGDLSVVKRIYKCPSSTKQWYSFATKYCSWHNQKAYPIYDQNVWEALSSYRKQNGFQFKNAELDEYPGFVAVVARFRKEYDLEKYSFKRLDKFLWVVGDRIIKSKRRK